MAIFKIAEIDRGLEWRILDQVIAKGFWADKRAFITSGDEPAYQAALKALTTKIEVFGVGVYKDREQLKRNNLIIDRISIGKGDVGSAYPFRIDLLSTGVYQKLKTALSTNHVQYEVRFVCDDVTLDREVNQIMLNAINDRVNIPGIKSDLTNTTETFDVFRTQDPADISTPEYIERVWRLLVTDVNVQEETVEIASIPPIVNIDFFISPGGDPDQIGDDWIGDPASNILDNLKVPLVTAAAINVPTAIQLDFDQNIRLSGTPAKIPFVISVDGSPKTDITVVDSPIPTRARIFFAAAFTAGEVVTVSYTRGLGGEAVRNQKLVEMETLQNEAVTNNL